MEGWGNNQLFSSYVDADCIRSVDFVCRKRQKELDKFCNVFQFMIKLSSGFRSPGWIEKNY